MNINYFGTVSVTGILQIPNRKRLQSDLQRFAGCSIELVIKKKNRRSTQQNRYLWGVVYKEVEIRMRELGNDVDSDLVHDFFKDKFLQRELIGEGGEVIDKIPGSSKELNKTDFIEYVDKIILWSAETLSISIPAPNTDLQLQF